MTSISPQDRLHRLATGLDRLDDVAGYQLNWTDAKSLRGGFVNKELGDIYHPIKAMDYQGGNFSMAFKNGSIARGTLSLNSTVERIMDVARHIAYRDKEPLALAKPEPDYTPPELADEAIINLIEKEPSSITRFVRELHEASQSIGVENVEGDMTLSHSRSAFVNSKGASYISEQTGQESIVAFDSDIIQEKKSRKHYEIPSLHKRLEYIGDFAKNIAQPRKGDKPGVYPILIGPDDSGSILDRFVGNSLGGLSVDSRTGKFTPEDFTAKRMVFNPRISLKAEQCVDYSSEGFAFTSDGVVPQNFEVIKEGRLVEPICSPRIAQKLALPARALGSLSECSVQGAIDYGVFAANHDRFIIVLGAMGIHTQNSILGNYSLPSPYAIMVEHGKLVGGVNCVLSGNIFEALVSDDFNFVKMPLAYDKPLISFKSQVTFK